MTQYAVVHADESCLGNGRDGTNPGGGGALVEIRLLGDIVRSDIFISAPDTTNNRMALNGAIATLALLSQKGKRLRVAYVSDSKYLVQGMNEWVHAWRARGWRRKSGEVENLVLWKKLVSVAGPHAVTWMWVRGHAGHAKNEYADTLAVRAAREQVHSQGAEPSAFDAWMDRKREQGQFSDYDPDEAFTNLVAQLETGR